jgi:hypothetical protein
MLRTLVIAATALATGLAAAAAAHASDWRTDPDSYESGLFLDVSSYKVLPSGNRQIWIMQILPKPVASRGGLVDFRINLVEFDCAGRSSATKDAIVYYTDGKVDVDETGAASPIASGAGADRMSDVVCGDMSRLTSVPGDPPYIAHRYRALAKMAFQ